MERRNDPMSLFVSEGYEGEWPAAAEPRAVAARPVDGRWAFVTTSLGALLVGFVAWLAFQTTAPVNSRGFEHSRLSLIPYHLFQQMSSSGRSSVAGGEVYSATDAGSPFAAFYNGKTNNATPGTETHTVTLDYGETLAGMLEDAGVNANDANAVVTAMSRVYNPRSMRAGLVFDLTLTAAKPQAGGADQGDASMQLSSLKFSPSIEHDITVTRAADGTYSASDALKQLTVQTHRAGITVDSSLYLSAMKAGIPADVVVEMIHMFSYKVDFQRDIQPGDSFEVYYDYYYTPQGQPARVGNISFAKMRLGGKEVSLYRFQSDPNMPADYFDAKGQSAKGMLMKTPVDGARITSGFGMRFHPVLGYTRMHKGIDFGVPIGTPVMAAGSGVVKFAGVQNGYGNFVIIDHGNGYATAYGHLSRIATGIHMGSHVRQAQLVAYSGMTGIATGPHLHYEIRIKGQQVNPLRVKMADGRKLSGSDLRKFLSERMRIDALMARTNLETKVAVISDKPK